MTADTLSAAIATHAGRQWTIEQVDKLLPIYFAPDHAPQQHAAILEAFADVLHLQPRWAVARALADWKAQHSRRPTPAELRILAERAHAELLDEYRRRNRPAPEPIPDPPTDAEKARVRELVEAFRRSVGEPVSAKPEAVAARFRASDAELAAARDANPLVRAARADAARRAARAAE